MTPDPRTDPTIAALSADRRAVLAGLWQERACSESSVGTVFEQLRHERIASAAPAEVIALATRAADDELPEAGVPGHGYPPRAVLLAAVHDAIRALVLSGFDHVGIDTTAARSWYATREHQHQRQRGG